MGGSHIVLAEFCQLVDKCYQIPARRVGQRPSAEKRTVASYFANWCERCEPATRPAGTGLCLFRLLFPELDIRRRYDMQEARLIPLLAEALRLPDKIRGKLEKWKDDSDHCDSREAGCLGLLLQKILEEREKESAPAHGHGKGKEKERDSAQNDTMGQQTLQRVDELLDELAFPSPFSASTLARPLQIRTPTEVLRELYSDVSPQQAAVLTQIILKDLRPLLYPLPHASARQAMLQYNSASHAKLDEYTAMRAWHWAMEHVYRVQASFDHAAKAVESISRDVPRTDVEQRQLLQSLYEIKVGHLIQIPKAIKGRSIEQAVKEFKDCGLVWAETKYDGERMQVHVIVRDSGHAEIRIFSKSKRDSTVDRLSAHPMLEAALGLHGRRDAWPALLKERCPKQLMPPNFKQCIVEAELVAYSESDQAVDEFHHVGLLLGRFGRRPDQLDDGSSSYHTSQGSSHDSQERRDRQKQVKDDIHLALVFFDCLYLDQSLLDVPYEQRRHALEGLVKPITGHCMLAERDAIVMDEDAEETLQACFDDCVKAKKEGLMLKAADSWYNDLRRGGRWLKLKSDYLPGQGDTGSFCIIGAGWDKDRARDLGAGFLTTWYVGLQTNRRECTAFPSMKPHYLALFSTNAYGLDRTQSLRANEAVRNRGTISRLRWEKIPPSKAPYSLSFDAGLKIKPSYILPQPVVFELMGGSFDKNAPSKLYSLRHPRVLHLHFDRPLEETVTLQELQEMAQNVKSIAANAGRSQADSDWASAYSDLEDVAPPVPAPPSPPKKRKRPLQVTGESQERAAGDQGSKPSRKRQRSRIPIPSPSSDVENAAVEQYKPAYQPATPPASGSRRVEGFPDGAVEAAQTLVMQLRGLRELPPSSATPFKAPIAFWLDKSQDPHLWRRQIPYDNTRCAVCVPSTLFSVVITTRGWRNAVFFVGPKHQAAVNQPQEPGDRYVFSRSPSPDQYAVFAIKLEALAPDADLYRFEQYMLGWWCKVQR